MALSNKKIKPKPEKKLRGGKKVLKTKSETYKQDATNNKTSRKTLDLREQPEVMYRVSKPPHASPKHNPLAKVLRGTVALLSFLTISLWNVFAKTMDMIIDALIGFGLFVYTSCKNVLAFGAKTLAGLFTSMKLPEIQLPERPQTYIPHAGEKKAYTESPASIKEEPTTQEEERAEENTTPEHIEEKQQAKKIKKPLLDERSFRLEPGTLSLKEIILWLVSICVGLYVSFKDKFGWLYKTVVHILKRVVRSVGDSFSKMMSFRAQSPRFAGSEKETTIEMNDPVEITTDKDDLETSAAPQNTEKTGLFHFIMSKIQEQKKTKLGTFVHRSLILGLIALFMILGGFFIWVATLEIPELGNFADRDVRQSTKIYDSTGTTLLYDVFKEERRTVVEIEEVSDNVKLAILATEDDEFYNHSGVRPVAIMRSIIQKIKDPNSRLAGGSTITQQVIKNSILTNERRVERKVKEWVLAWRLERQLSKDEILEAYLNEIAFGGSVYGVEQAARSFYGKSAAEVSIAEAAYIAAVPKAPTFYSPYGQNRDRLEGRKNYILGRMRDLGYISSDQYEDARSEEVEFVVREDKGIKAPHFVFYVIEQLEREYGAETVERGGLRVITTLDWDLQKEFEAETTAYVENLAQYRASNLASVGVEVGTGKIRAMVGSKDYFADDIDGKFNIATAFRQPGSTFKPFVYALAFERGYTPSTMLWDVRTEFSASCFADGTPKPGVSSDACYMPQNYDSRVRGPIAMGAALAQSLNIPAVKALYLVGVGDAIRYAKDMGVTGLNRSASFYGLSLVLGGGEVRLLDMVSSYATFADEGVKTELSAIEQVTSPLGEVLFEAETEQERVISQQAARTINDVLSDDNLKRPIYGSRSVLYHDNADVAVKTGTTNSFKDTWTVGYTPEIAVGVWIGNNDNTPMAERPSSVVASPYWRRLMDQARELYPAGRFTPPVYPDSSTLPPVLAGSWQGDRVSLTDSRTGESATEETPLEFIQTQYQPAYHSILHWVSKRDPLSGGTSQSDSLYENWELAVRSFAQAAGYQEAIDIEGDGTATSTETGQDGDGEEDDRQEIIQGGGGEDQTIEIFIQAPSAGATIPADRRQEIEVGVSGGQDRIERVFYYVNNTYLGSESALTTTVSFTPSSIRNIGNTNTVKVIMQLEDGSRIEKRQTFTIASGESSE